MRVSNELQPAGAMSRPVWETAALATVARAMVAVGILAAGTMSAAAQSSPPPGSWNMYSGYTDTTRLTFTNNPLPNPVQPGNFPSLQLTLSGNHTQNFTMDTGSTGIVVAQQHFTPGPNDVQLGPGNALYTSDNVLMQGTYWQTQVTVTGENGNKITSNVKILVVPDSYGNVKMMGVGFDRGGNKPRDGQAIDQPQTDQNPFLNIVAINGAPVTNMRKGYVVGSQGVVLGLTAEQSSNFAIVKLTPNTIVPANVWNRPNMSMSVDGTSIGTGGLLADTGIAYMIATPIGQIPEGKLETCNPSHPGQCLKVNNDMTINLLPGLPADVAAKYKFTVVEDRTGRPLNPSQVNFRPEDGTNVLATEVSLNTGLSFYMGFDYLVDFDGGYAGYRWANAAGADGGV
ncbi:MAG TPA: hypothetical protein VEC60_03580, partial [Reyranella sp.]|nr:hypothetical protein [Reyranella sp.]